MDTLYIKGLTLKTRIGVYAWERQILQTVVFDLEFGIDNGKAATSDAIEDALDYATLTAQLSHFLAEQETQLIETLAERTADFLMERYALPSLRLSLSKPGAVKAAATTGVTIQR